MRNLIRKILKESVNKKTIKDTGDEILKNSYLEVVDEKWVRPKYDELLYGIRRPKYDQYFKDNHNITNLQDMFEVQRNVKERIAKMKKNYGFAFEHRLPYFEYPLSLYDLEKETNKNPE